VSYYFNSVGEAIRYRFLPALKRRAKFIAPPARRDERERTNNLAACNEEAIAARVCVLDDDDE
jgi:hypothetical protein